MRMVKRWFCDRLETEGLGEKAESFSLPHRVSMAIFRDIPTNQTRYIAAARLPACCCT